MKTAPKETLIKTYLSHKRQLERVNQLLEEKRVELKKLEGRVAESRELMEIYEQNKIEQVERDNRIVVLERYLAKAETLAARENSKQNSTPQARELNHQIGELFEKIYKAERQATQMAMDIDSLQNEINNIKSEREEKQEQSAVKLANTYRNIQQLREEASQIRFSTLTNFVKKKDILVEAEIEYQTLNTNVGLYQELVNSLKYEISALENKSTQMIPVELDKLNDAISRIPSHPVYDQSESSLLKSQFEAKLSDVLEMEKKIMSSISQMSRAEDEQDKLNKTIREENQRNTILTETLVKAETQAQEMRRQIEEMKAKDATKLDDANQEIEKLTSENLQLADSNEDREAKLQKMREGNFDIGKKTPIDFLWQRIIQEVYNLEKETASLAEKEAKLKEKLATDPIN